MTKGRLKISDDLFVCTDTQFSVYSGLTLNQYGVASP